MALPSGVLPSGVVLAGGVSRRLGRDKRFLPLDGEPLLARVIARLRPCVAEIILAAREPEGLEDFGARVVLDVYPGRGVLAGVHAGLAAARGAWAFVVGGDMPLLNPALLRAMAARAVTDAACDVVVPRWRGELEPLHALYRAGACAPAAEAALARGQRRIVAFYPQVRVCEMGETEIARHDPQGRSFFNVNTPEDWAALRGMGDGDG